MAAFVFLVLFAATCPSPLPFILAVACHECAHILCAFFLGMGKPKFRIKRAWLRLEYKTASAAKNIILCLSGPVAGILLGIVFTVFTHFLFALCRWES